MTTAPPRAADTTSETTICLVCGLSGGPFERAEAAYLIGLHNDLHHGDPSAPVPATYIDPATSVAASHDSGAPAILKLRIQARHSCGARAGLNR